MEAALQDAHKAVAPCVCRVDGQQHQKTDHKADQDAQQSSQHTGDGAVQTAVGKFFLVHVLFALLSLLACACHIQAQLLHGGGLGVKFAHDLALVHHKDAVGQVHHLVQLQTDQ